MSPQYAQKSYRYHACSSGRISTVKLLPSNSAILTLMQPWRAECAALLPARPLPLRAAHLLFPWPRAPQPARSSAVVGPRSLGARIAGSLGWGSRLPSVLLRSLPTAWLRSAFG